MKQIDDRFIGKGEKSALVILKKIFSTADIQIQFPFCNLMNEEFFGSLSDRQKKETLDIVVFRDDLQTVVIRVQDKTHVGTMKSARDIVQKKMLEWNPKISIENGIQMLLKNIDDWVNCPVYTPENTIEVTKN